MGTLLKHKNQYQTFNRALAQPKSKWQSLGAILKHSWRSRIESRCHSQSASQHCTRLPWWHPQHSPLAPTPRIAAHSYRATSLPAGTEHHVVDLRSDTVTRPSPEMRQAMAQAEVGDDDYGEDPTVNELQNVTADLLGKEEALFVPTATMANLIAVMCHCRRRGAQLLLGRQAHIHVFEHGGVAQVAGVHSEILQDLPDGTINLDELEHKIQQSYGSQYHPRPELICLENTHCSAGGRVLPLQYLQEGVGAPAGALLAGQREFIAEAWRMRKLLGGGMRQAGVLAAAALVGLRHMEETLQKDHNNARSFAEGVCSLGSSLCSVNLASVETNIVMMTTSASRLAPAKLCELMEAVSEEEVATTGQAISVRLFPWGEHLLRAVWHCDVSAHDTQLAGSKLRFVLDKWEQEHVHVY
ncbi:uncharacterized protein LOC132581262 isoform X2 [Heteronotia binoei]|uniref:uncharacterized protein LOC132581262 isoform X2 n=1 Tax=Heteronotia binoei TaxID=13085 RepID=UPI00293157C8|nr:uncharacterized protein LOC132581262 isoform X2 [Heteronotia binoei]